MKRVLVVGDIILDKFTYGTRLGISAETPTVVSKYESMEQSVGGAGLVTRNLLRLGCEVTLVNVPFDRDGLYKIMLGQLDPGEDLNLNWIQLDVTGWKNVIKHRYIVDGYKMVQFDTLNDGRWNNNTLTINTRIIDLVEKELKTHDCLVLCDNRHGVLEQQVGRYLVDVARRVGKPCYVDSQVSQKETNIQQYKGCSYTFMNERELDALVIPDGRDRVERLCVAESLLACKVILKLGAEGSISSTCSVPARRVFAIDTCGAGDAYLAAFVSSHGDMVFATEWATRSTLYEGTEIPPREVPHK